MMIIGYADTAIYYMPGIQLLIGLLWCFSIISRQITLVRDVAMSAGCQQGAYRGGGTQVYGNGIHTVRVGWLAALGRIVRSNFVVVGIWTKMHIDVGYSFAMRVGGGQPKDGCK
jgi:hypothetical protein